MCDCALAQHIVGTLAQPAIPMARQSACVTTTGAITGAGAGAGAGGAGAGVGAVASFTLGGGTSRSSKTAFRQVEFGGERLLFGQGAGHAQMLLGFLLGFAATRQQQQQEQQHHRPATQPHPAATDWSATH